MKPEFRYTLDRTKVIADPVGWDEIELMLSRHEDYYSVIEEINIPLTFVANNGIYDGGYEYLKQKRDAGVDSLVTIEITVSWDYGESFDTLWNGVLDLTELVEIESKKQFQCTILRDDRWSRFINRKSIPVNIRDTVTIDGASATAFQATAHTLNLPSQKIYQRYIGFHTLSVNYSIPQNTYGTVDFDNETIKEIKTKYNYPLVQSTTRPFELFSMDFDGEYDFDVRITVVDTATGLNQVANLRVLFQINDNTAVDFLITNLGINGVNGRTQFTYTAGHTLKKGDFVRIYFFVSTGGGTTFTWYTGGTDFLTVDANTTFEDTTADGFFIHDVARSIIGHTTGEEYFYSEYFGGGGTDKVYGEDGCGAYYRLLGGSNLRGKSISDKPFSMSWDELWEGIDPIFNVGLGYELIQGVEKVRVEPKSYFFDDSSDSIQLDYVDNIEISYDPDYLLTSVEIGYQKWQDEVASGLDDPQTVHTYGTRLKRVGRKDVKNVKLLSTLVAASLLIEQGRRLSLDTSKDWKFDEEKFIIQTTSSLSPQEVKLYSNQVITGLQNSETRYNVRLTPASNFNRWKDYLFIAFQTYVGDVFRFLTGEGNTSMVFNDPNAAGCDAEAGKSVTENENKTITTDCLFLPTVYKFTHPLTWNEYKGLRDLSRKSFAITYYNNEDILKNAKLFIKNVKYRPNESKADFECWLKSLT